MTVLKLDIEYALNGMVNYSGVIYRGIAVDKQTFESYFTKDYEAQHKIESWTPNRNVAVLYSEHNSATNNLPYKIIFVNESGFSKGVNVTDISPFGEIEPEILKPANVKYSINKIRYAHNDVTKIYAYVEENKK